MPPGESIELILTVNMETRDPVESYFNSKFRQTLGRSVIIAELRRPEVARR